MSFKSGPQYSFKRSHFKCRTSLYTTPKYFTEDWLNEHEREQVKPLSVRERQEAVFSHFNE